LVIGSVSLGFLDIFGLSRFIATAQEHDDRVTILGEVDAEARPEVDLEFLDAALEFAAKTKVALHHAVQMGRHDGLTALIAEPF